MPDVTDVVDRACALAARRRDEWSDDEVVADLVGFSGGDPAVLEEGWRRCARRDADGTTRAAAALLHRAWARVNGYRETILVPARPRAAVAESAAPAGAAPAAIAAPPPSPTTAPPEGRWRRLWARLTRRG